MQPQDLESAVGVIQKQKEKELAAGAHQEGALDAESLAKFLLLHVEAEQVRHFRISNQEPSVMLYFLAVSVLTTTERKGCRSPTSEHDWHNCSELA